MDRSACWGIQYLKLMYLGNANGVRSYCCEKWTYVAGRWLSNDCLFVVNLGAPKQRCIKSSGVYSNSWPALHLRLFLERAAAAADDKNWVPDEKCATTIRISQHNHHSLVGTHTWQVTTRFFLLQERWTWWVNMCLIYMTRCRSPFVLTKTLTHTLRRRDTPIVVRCAYIVASGLSFQYFFSLVLPYTHPRPAQRKRGCMFGFGWGRCDCVQTRAQNNVLRNQSCCNNTRYLHRNH